MGEDIGFSDREVIHKSTVATGGGLEFLREKSTRTKFFRAWKKEGKDISPRILKHPIARPATLDAFFERTERYGWEYDLVIWMVRDLDQVIKSTISHRKLRTNAANVDWAEVEATWRHRLPLVMAEMAQRFTDFPLLVVYHPDFATNRDYAKVVMRPVLKLIGKSNQDFIEAWDQVSRPERVTVYE
jgi:hypothetical protein